MAKAVSMKNTATAKPSRSPNNRWEITGIM